MGNLPPTGVALAQVVLYIILIILCWFTVLARLYVRVFVVKGLGADDKIIIGALVGFTGLAVLAMGMGHLGLGQHEAQLLPFQIQWVLTIIHCEEVLYGLTTVTVKFSIMRLLLRLATQRSHRWLLKGTAYCYLFATVAFVALSILQCWPVPRYWNPQIPGYCMPLSIYTAVVYAYAVINLTADGIFSIWPTFLIWNLQLDRKTKISTAIVLGLVFTASGVNLARFKYIGALAEPLDRTYVLFPINLTSNLEIAIGIITASLGTLRPLLTKVHWKLPSLTKLSHTNLRYRRPSTTTVSPVVVQKPDAEEKQVIPQITQEDIDEWSDICNSANTRAEMKSKHMMTVIQYESPV